MMQKDDVPEHDKQLAPLERSLDRLLSPFENFYRSQSSSGVLLLASAIIAIFLANSTYQSWYFSIGDIKLYLGIDDGVFSHSVHYWVNDGLMAIFFFLLGLEIKREILAGELKDIRQSTLVLFMAAGGMIVPACIYLAFNFQLASANGWGISMATDTAFALGALALLGSKAPRSAAVLLSALAIVDDIGAVLVISIFYTDALNLQPLLYAFFSIVFLVCLNLLGVRRITFYFLGGVILWWCILHSGIHTTTAGILAAITVPTRPYAGTNWFKRRIRMLLYKFESLDSPHKTILEENQQHELVEQVQKVAVKTVTPLQHWNSILDKPVSFIIVPLFAFLNAGVVFPKLTLAAVSSPVLLGTTFGLVLGKCIGISLFAWLAMQLGIAKLPSDFKFSHIIALSLLAGMGFTMSLFIATLAFGDYPQLLAQAKIGILSGSAIAGAAGFLLFIFIYKRHSSAR